MSVPLPPASGPAARAATPPARRQPRILACACLLAVSLGFLAGLLLRENPGSADLGAESPSVTSQPQGATVFLNGQPVGLTPLRLGRLARGTYSLRFEKEGWQDLLRQFSVPHSGAGICEQLALLPQGSLRVNLEPRGAEVLLDGQRAGHTPLWLAEVPAGPHELLVRKSGYDPFSQRLNVPPGQVCALEGFALHDHTEEMLRRLVAFEPWRVSHYTELAHYLSVRGRMADAGQAYIQGLDKACVPLPPQPDWSPHDAAAEDTQRADSLQRLNQILRQRWNQGGNGGETLHKVLEQPEALVPLLIMRLQPQLRDFEGARETYRVLLDKCALDPRPLRRAAQGLQPLLNGFGDPERGEVDGWVERLLRAARAAAKEPGERGHCASDLAQFLTAKGSYEEALLFHEQAVLGAMSEELKEDRLLAQAGCLVKAGLKPKARAIYSGLLRCEREAIRSAARTGLENLPKK